MSKIKYVFSAAIIALLCCITAFAYEAESFDDYAAYTAEMVFGTKDDVSLMSVEDEGEFGCKRIFVEFSAKAYLPDEIHPTDYVLYGNTGVYEFATADLTQQAYTLLKKLPDAEEVVVDSIITLEAMVDDVEVQDGYEIAQNRIESQNWGFAGANVNSYKDYVNGKNADEVVIGIVDSGLAQNHPYFAETDRLIPGYNLVDPAQEVCDYHGHGTHVAGIAMSSTTDNVKIKMYQVFNSELKSSVLLVKNAIEKAIEDKVDVINLSLSVACNEGYCHSTLDDAYNAGIIVVVAAGNGATDEDGVRSARPVSEFCPAHHYENLITVGATNEEKGLYAYSNYGPEVDICAPGEKIYSTYYDPKTDSLTYATISGTSMAAPLVAGFAAMAKSVDSDMTFEKLVLLMTECAEKPEGWDLENNGAGILNMGLCTSLVEGVFPHNVQFTQNETTGEVEFHVQVENETEDPVDFITYITFYNESGVQIGSHIDSFNIKSGRKSTFSIPIEQMPQTATSVKGYVWTGDMKPICMTRDFNLTVE